MIFPILRGILTQPSLLPGCELAMMALDALWPSPGPAADAGPSPSPGLNDDGLCWLEGPHPVITSRALLPLHASLTLTVLAALHRMPRLDPPLAVVLTRIIAEYPALKLAGEDSNDGKEEKDDDETKVIGDLADNTISTHPYHPSLSSFL